MIKFNKILLFLSFLFLFTIAFSQAKSKYTTNQKAIKLYNDAIYDCSYRKFEDAEKKLNKAIGLDNNFLEAYCMLAEIKERNNDRVTALKYYYKAYEIDPNNDLSLCYKIATNSYRLGEYNSAKEYMDKFWKNSDTLKLKNTVVSKIKSFIDFSYISYNNPVDYNPISVGIGVNTEYDEYWPSLSIDEQTLVFTRLLPRNIKPTGNKMYDFQEDLFVSQRDIVTNDFQKAFPMQGTINTANNEGAQCISADGKTCVITCCNRPEGKGSCDLYIMFNRNGRWTVPENMKTVNTEHWESNPSLSADGKILYFSSGRPGGYGKKDIWKVRLDAKGNAIGKAENLGNIINTEDNDVSPFIHPDGKTLYFASDGHPGMGGQDIFFSRSDSNGKWQKPINMGYPINTIGEEQGLIVNAKGDLAMYASEKNSNNLDIFMFKIPLEIQPTTVTYIKGYIYNIKNKEKIGDADCVLINLETKEKENSMMSESITGEFLVAVPANNDYAFNVYKQGYLFYSENFSLKNIKNPSEPFLINIPLTPIEEGSTVILKNIFFEFNSFELLPESFAELGKLVEYMTNNSTIKIEIGGHTDNIGSKEYNKNLSENRAKAVYEYLINNGINKERLSYAGYDFSKNISTNETEEGRALNRRTEFKIISIK